MQIYAALRCAGTRPQELPVTLHGPGCGSASALGVVNDVVKAALRLQGSLPAGESMGDLSPALRPADPPCLTPLQLLF